MQVEVLGAVEDGGFGGVGVGGRDDGQVAEFEAGGVYRVGGIADDEGAVCAVVFDGGPAALPAGGAAAHVATSEHLHVPGAGGDVEVPGHGEVDAGEQDGDVGGGDADGAAPIGVGEAAAGVDHTPVAARECGEDGGDVDAEIAAGAARDLQRGVADVVRGVDGGCAAVVLRGDVEAAHWRGGGGAAVVDAGGGLRGRGGCCEREHDESDGASCAHGGSFLESGRARDSFALLLVLDALSDSDGHAFLFDCDGAGRHG